LRIFCSDYLLALGFTSRFKFPFLAAPNATPPPEGPSFKRKTNSSKHSGLSLRH